MTSISSDETTHMRPGDHEREIADLIELGELAPGRARELGELLIEAADHAEAGDDPVPNTVFLDRTGGFYRVVAGTLTIDTWQPETDSWGTALVLTPAGARRLRRALSLAL